MAASVVFTAAAGLPARAGTGKWTNKVDWSEGDPERYAVHMMLLRGDGDPYHSRVLWWQGEAQIPPATETKFYGGEWGWTPGNDDCSTYPTSNFVHIDVDTCGMNPFCGSHAILGDGRVLMAGGHNPFIMDYGDNRVRIFKDSTGTNKGRWSVAHEMNSWRWYPTATTLRDGRALLTSGNQYRQHQIFGGKRNGSAPATLTGDSLYRFAPIPGGKWDAAIYPDSASGNLRPTPRYAHSAVATEHVKPFNAQVYFGGRKANDAPLDDTWFQYIAYYDQLRSDPQYLWAQPTITGGPPHVRSDHTAVVALDTCMVVFGGLDETNAGRSDVWRLFYDSSLQPPSFSWSQITPTDTIPPARFGHCAIYDKTIRSSAPGDTLRRMIMFGGRSTPDQAPTDSRVWELRFSSPNANSATWHEMPQDTLGSNGSPSARYWHTMNMDPTDRVLGTRGTCHVAFMFGGKLDASTCSNDLWRLWIFKNGHVGWEKITSGTSPDARARHTAVLDTAQSGYHGRLYIYGGVAANGDPADSHVHVIDPWGGRYSSWTQWGDLVVSLAGQTALIDDEEQVARAAEVYNSATDPWTALSSATMRQQTYPPVFVVPGGTNDSCRVITINHNSESTYSLDIPATGQSRGWNKLTNGHLDCLPEAGVLYRPNRLLVAGGQDSATRSATGKTRLLNASSLSNQWDRSGAADMVPRLNPNLVLLPTGNILAVGGNQSSDSGDPVKRPQMWSFATDSTGSWSGATDLEEQPTIRGYHSTAILLPDGRVLSAGGSDNQGDTNSDQHTADIFCPPYLFNSAGTALVERPGFSNPARPESLGFGNVFTICVPDTLGITRACLIRPGATTHAFDQNQRYVPLVLKNAASPMRLLATSPASPDAAPPGDYMLFLTGKGSYGDVPSIAKWVRVVARGLDLCDVVPPNNNDNLTADCDPDVPNGWTLSWLAPGDDADLAASGPASSFEMRRSSSHITGSNFASATLMGTPAPGVVGTQHTVSAAAGSSPKYIRLRTRDDNNQNSGLGEEAYIYNWSGQFDCYGGDGMTGGGGEGGGYSAGRAPGFAALRSETETPIPENSLLPGSRTGEESRDAWRLASGLWSVKPTYTVRIRERAGRAAAVDQVRLVAVDHAPGLEALGVGSGYTAGERRAAARVTSGEGSDLTGMLDGSAVFTAASGETLSVDLGSGGAASPLVVEAAGKWPCSVEVLTPDGKGGWQSRGRLQPRRGMDALPFEALGSDVVRLTVLGQVSFKFVGSLATSGAPPTIQSAALASANSVKLGDVSTGVGGSDNLSATLAGPDTLVLAFEAPPLEGAQVRDYFLEVEATPVSGKTLAALQRAVEAPSIPTRFALRQNRPNPFNATTAVWFDLPVGAMVRLDVFDAQGRRVGILANRYFPPGSHAVPWNPSSGGRRIGPGVYFCRLDAGAFHDRRKMTLIP